MKLTQKQADTVKIITTMLTALMFFLGTLGYTFDKFNANTIEAFGIFLAALIPFGGVLYGIWMNTFTRLESFQKAQEKEAQRLIEEGKIDPNGSPRVVELDVPENAEDGADL